MPANEWEGNVEQRDDTDSFDKLLRAMEPGLIVTINENEPQSRGWPNMVVDYSWDDKTKVGLTGHGDEYRIVRRDGDIVIGDSTPVGVRNTESVTTIEVLGIDTDRYGDGGVD